MQGMLATWVDFDPAGEADFNEWYNTEHLLERAMVPGFYNARRYVAVYGSPKYMALYDTESPDVLTSKSYKRILENPTEWSMQVMPQFRNFDRCVAEQVYQYGQGWAQIAISLRISIPENEVDHVITRLVDTVLPAASEASGTVGLFLMKPLPPSGGPKPAEVSGPPITLFLNAACLDEQSANEALHGALSPQALESADIPARFVRTGMYRFVCGVDRAVAERAGAEGKA